MLSALIPESAVTEVVKQYLDDVERQLLGDGALAADAGVAREATRMSAMHSVYDDEMSKTLAAGEIRRASNGGPESAT